MSASIKGKVPPPTYQPNMMSTAPSELDVTSLEAPPAAPSTSVTRIDASVTRIDTSVARIDIDNCYHPCRRRSSCRTQQNNAAYGYCLRLILVLCVVPPVLIMGVLLGLMDSDDITI